MIYGGNGYTGALIAREAASRGLKPILAGRTAAKVEQLATPFYRAAARLRFRTA